MPDLHYIRQLLTFSVRMHPAILLGGMLGIGSILVEIVAVGTLLPLSTYASKGALPADSVYVRILAHLGIQPSFSTLLIVLALLFALRVITQFANLAVAASIGKRVQAQLSSKAFEEVIHRFSLRDIEEKSIGHFITLAGDQTARAGNMIVLLNQTMAAVFLAMMYLATVFYFSAFVGLFVVALLATSAVALLIPFRASTRLGQRLTDLQRGAYSVFLDSMNGLRSVRAFGAEAFVSDQYAHVIRNYTRTGFRIELLNLLSRAIPALLLLVGAAGLAALFPANAGADDVPYIVTVVVLLLRFFPAASQCLNLGLKISAESNAAKDVTRVVAANEATASARSIQTPSSPVASIVGVDVTFSHGAKRVLAAFDFEFVRGRSYALVGPSGSGKSTLFDLLLRFYEPDSGVIRLNDRPLARIDAAWLRRHVLLLGQQPTIFNDTVRNNITFGMPISGERVDEACRLAHLQEVVEGLEGGLDTVLAYQGANLSGGQRQRIGLARALARNADVLFLDESTSALDVATRDAVVSGILKAYEDKIVVFATHDPEITRRVHTTLRLDGPLANEPDADRVQEAAAR